MDDDDDGAAAAADDKSSDDDDVHDQRGWAGHDSDSYSGECCRELLLGVAGVTGWWSWSYRAGDEVTGGCRL